jgi:SAM-dependent methyltransferase
VSALLNRPRLRALITRAAQSALDAVDQPQASVSAASEPREIGGSEVLPSDASNPHGGTKQGAHDDDLAVIDRHRFQRELAPGLLAVEQSTVVRRLYDRLSTDDVAATEQVIRDTPGAWEHYAAAPDDPARRHLLLALGMWLSVERLIEKTGLIRAEPPDEVHSMTRGALAAAGGLYEADLVIDALIGAGVDMSSVTSGLDFGCSSGRVVRSLAAAYPAIAWHGSDPNAPAIEWAAENLPGTDFFVNDNHPPLPLADASLDLVYAISIWSHFAPMLGLRWFEEMHRVLRPGGHLVCTTHGLTSVAHYATLELRTPEQSREIADALYTRGWWYAPEFGEEGDWGVINPDWGTAFLSPEWMLTQLCPQWRVLEFAPGRNQENQDVYVLERA